MTSSPPGFAWRNQGKCSVSANLLRTAALQLLAEKPCIQVCGSAPEGRAFKQLGKRTLVGNPASARKGKEGPRQASTRHVASSFLRLAAFQSTPSRAQSASGGDLRPMLEAKSSQVLPLRRNHSRRLPKAAPSSKLAGVSARRTQRAQEKKERDLPHGRRASPSTGRTLLRQPRSILRTALLHVVKRLAANIRP